MDAPPDWIILCTRAADDVASGAGTVPSLQKICKVERVHVAHA